MGDVMHINNKPLSNFNAEMQWSHNISGNKIQRINLLGKNRSTLKPISKQVLEKSYTLQVDFYGSREERVQNKNSFDNECLKENVVISIGDGYEYHGTCEQLGDETPGPVITETSYTFSGFRKKPIVAVSSNKIYCISTFPQTDCIFSVTVGASTTRYRLWDAWFLNVSKGDRIVFDGINCRILINNSPRATQCEWIDFPYLVPGVNNIECSDIVTVEYYPTFL